VSLLALLFLFFFAEAEARPVTPADMGKVSSREISGPFPRQGTCLVFRYGRDVYCLSSYHVAYSAWSPNFEHTLSFVGENGKHKLEWFASDWGRGMVMLKVANPPARNYLNWEEIPRGANQGGRAVFAMGFPLGSESLNEAAGVTIDRAVIPEPLFVYVDEFVLVADLASEVGFSGGALVNEASEYMGLLSHQINRGGRLVTAAIPAEEVHDWADRHLRGGMNRSFFYVQPEEIANPKYNLYLRNLTFRVEEFPRGAAKIMVKAGPQAYESLVIEHLAMKNAGKHFPGGENELVGCIPLWPAESVNEIRLFRRGVEPIRFLFRPDLFADDCGYYQFLRPGAREDLMRTAWQKLVTVWRKNFSRVDMGAYPVWLDGWVAMMRLGEGRRVDGDTLRQNNIPAYLRSFHFTRLRDEKVQLERAKLLKIYPRELAELEASLDALMAVHSASVLTVAYHEFMDKR
jgi:hypothetical protein